jgi:prophage regulatory protein
MGFTEVEPMSENARNYGLPEAGLVRLPQIIGNPKADPPIPAVIPICRASWWAGVKSGKFPQPIKLGPRTTCWRVDEIRALWERMSEQGLKESQK